MWFFVGNTEEKSRKHLKSKKSEEYWSWIVHVQLVVVSSNEVFPGQSNIMTRQGICDDYRSAKTVTWRPQTLVWMIGTSQVLGLTHNRSLSRPTRWQPSPNQKNQPFSEIFTILQMLVTCIASKSKSYLFLVCINLSRSKGSTNDG